MPEEPARFDLLAQHVPRHACREGRIALLLEAAHALRSGNPVSGAAGKLLGNALLDWLQLGGKLEQRLRISKRGSHDNVPRVVARLQVQTAAEDPADSDRFALAFRSSPMNDNGE